MRIRKTRRTRIKQYRKAISWQGSTPKARATPKKEQHLDIERTNPYDTRDPRVNGPPCQGSQPWITPGADQRKQPACEVERLCSVRPSNGNDSEEGSFSQVPHSGEPDTCGRGDSRSAEGGRVGGNKVHALTGQGKYRNHGSTPQVRKQGANSPSTTRVMTSKQRGWFLYGLLLLASCVNAAMQSIQDAFVNIKYHEDLADMCCDVNSALTAEATRKGLRARRLPKGNGYDFKMRETGDRIASEVEHNRTRRAWSTVPSIYYSPCQAFVEANPVW